MRESKPRLPAAEALRLLGRWQRVSTGHVVLGSGCSCGIETTSVRVPDFEQDILSFLRGRHRIEESVTSIAALLVAVARQTASAGAAERLALLADLERSIESFEAAHRGQRSSYTA
jgi:hypothetical protein